MYVAVLIGFIYIDEPITGVVVDLYRAYKFCQLTNTMCFVLTDMVDHPPEVNRAIIDRTVDDGIKSFTGKLAPDQEPLPNLKFYNVRNLQEIMGVIDHIDLTQEPRVMFYYSGHGEIDGMIRMPTGEKHDFIQFRDMLLSRCWDEAEILMLIDCCNSGDWGLPYRLDTRSKCFRLKNLNHLTLPVVILISASSGDEKAIASHQNSLFTRHLFDVLSTKKPSLSILVNKIQALLKQSTNIIAGADDLHQTVGVYSSYPIQPLMWSWVMLDGPCVTSSTVTSSLIISP